jgi:pilus assembly protein TadC
MAPTDCLGLAFALLALLAAGAFFWVGKNVAGFAFIAAFIISLTGVLQQRVVFSSAMVGLMVEKSNEVPNHPGIRRDE